MCPERRPSIDRCRLKCARANRIVRVSTRPAPFAYEFLILLRMARELASPALPSREANRRVPRVLSTMLRTVVRYRWPVVAFWASVTIASVVFLPSLASVVRNDTASFLPANAPSVMAARLAAPFLAPSGAIGELVATDTAGPLTPADLSAIKVVEDRALQSPLIVSVGGGAISVDGQAYSAQVRFTEATAG